MKKHFDTVFRYADGKLYWRVSPNRRIRVGDEAGCSSGAAGYATVCIQGKTYQLHRVVYTMHTGESPRYVDHIDGDITNNRIENLREATNQENSFNARTPANNTSGVKGVAWHKASGKWRAYLQTKAGALYLGYFTELSAAAEAVRLAREQHHGAFARHA